MSLFRTKPVDKDIDGQKDLKRSLNAFDLTMLGIGTIIGTGIFILTGVSAAEHAGPAIILSFVLAGIACACAALCYTELAASIGGAGSAYGYGYAGLGELPAWVIGWMLVLEYTVSVAAVSTGWSSYLTGFLGNLGFHIPAYFTNGPFDPKHAGLINLPAVLAVAGIGFLLAAGAKTGAIFNAIIVAVKLAAVALFIGVGVFHMDTSLWHPFIPPKEAIDGATRGFSWDMGLLQWLGEALGADPEGATRYGIAGIVGGASTIFFAYLGFDAVSTAAEETKNPQRDLPIGILASLGICTVLYIVVSALLTSMVPFRELDVGQPVAFALIRVGQNGAAGLISIGALAGLTTVLLGMFFGQSRVLFAMSRDGLLPSFFARVHPVTKTPIGSIIISGLVMLTLGGFVPLGKLVELANIGTLGAFIVVSVGVIVMRRTQPGLKRPFKMPLYPIVPIIGAASCTYLMLALSVLTWTSFLIWVFIGMFVYFGYSRSHAVLGLQKA